MRISVGILVCLCFQLPGVFCEKALKQTQDRFCLKLTHVRWFGFSLVNMKLKGTAAERRRETKHPQHSDFHCSYFL